MPHDAGAWWVVGLCPRGQSRVCAHVAHIAYVYSRCVPRPFSPHATSCFPPNPPFSLSPASPCVICPPWRVPRAVSSAPASRSPPAPATPSAGTPIMPSAGTPSADSPLVPKAEPDVPPGPTVAPSHDVASPNPPTRDAPEPQPALPPTGDVYLRVSRDALSRAEALTDAPPQSLHPAAKSQLAEL